MPGGLVDVVAERNRPVRRHGDAVQLPDPLRSIDGHVRVAVTESSGKAGLLPVREVALDGADLPVDAVLTADLVMEAETTYGRVAPEPPGVDLRTSELGAVDSRLLARANTEHHASVGVGDRVGLRV